MPISCMKNYALGAALILVIVILMSVGPGILAQTNPVTLNVQAPTQVIASNTPILAPKSDIRPFLEIIGNLSSTDYGGFFIQKFSGGPIYAMIKIPNNDAGEINLLEYDPNGKEFWLYDCYSGIGTATDNVTVSGGILTGTTSVTVDQFIARYNCDVDDLTDDPEYNETTSWLGNLSIESIIQNKKTEILTKINSSSTQLAGTEEGNPIQETSDDIAPTEFVINSPATTAVTLNSNYAASFAVTTVPSSSSKSPAQIIFRDQDGEEQYLLQIWRWAPVTYQSKPYIKVGIRLFAIENGATKALWSTYTTTPDAFTVDNQGNILPITKNHSQDQLALFNSPITTFTFDYKNGDNRGDISIDIINNLPLVQYDISFDAQKDQTFTTPQLLRLKLSQDTIAQLVQHTAYVDAATDFSKIYDNNRVKVTLSRVGEPDIQFTTVPKSTAKPATPYLVGGPIKPNDYKMEISIEGFKTIEEDVFISASDLSAVNDAGLLQLQIKDIEAFELTEDPCSTCQTIGECLACMDQGIIASYEK